MIRSSRLRISTCMAGALMTLFGATVVSAQSPFPVQTAAPSLFQYIEDSTTDERLPSDGRFLDSRSQAQYDVYRQATTTADLSVVYLDLATIRLAESVTLNLQSQDMTSDLLDNIRVEDRAADAYSWFGTVSTPSGSATTAILVVDGTQAVGTVRRGFDIYQVRPLNNGAHLLIRLDRSNIPPDHPPEFNDEFSPDGNSPESRDLLPPSPQQILLPDEDCREFSVLVAYTPAAKADAETAGGIDQLIQLAIDETNQGYRDSYVDMQVQLAHKHETTYLESGSMALDRDAFRIDGDGNMDEVHDLRENYAADVAILITSDMSACGYASAIGADDASAFAVVTETCATGYFSFAHEIGHLQGARHNPEQDPDVTPFAYGHGYYHQVGGWRTIMSYDCPGWCTRLNYWSNPRVTFEGEPMGTDVTHFNAKVLENTACTVAAFRRKSREYVATIPLYGVYLADGGAEEIEVDFGGRFSRIEEIRVRLAFFGDLWDRGERWSLSGMGGQINSTGSLRRNTATLRVPYPTAMSQGLINDGRFVTTLRSSGGSMHATELVVTVVGLD